MTAALNISIRPMVPSDWARVRAIYAAGIAIGNATFETEAPEWEAWDSGHLQELRFIAVQDDAVRKIAAPIATPSCAIVGLASIAQ
jgi:L-amino acid N-acyltransferase YncA